MKAAHKYVLITIMAMLSGGWNLVAQPSPSIRTLLQKADSLQKEYDFEGAMDLYEDAMDEETDSLILAAIAEAMLSAQNGYSMMSYCSKPVVVTKRHFPLKDFFLYYPLRDKSWRGTPNQLDSANNDCLQSALYFPSDAGTVLYSALDKDGIRNIYITELADTVWSYPRLINEDLTSVSEDIFPMLSPDGKSLYFSSKGLYGAGGYDLYESTWNPDTRDWNPPVNMGFPYSSPYDDFLFINSDDGRFSIFASNRETSADSVCIYVLEYENMPVRTAIADTKELKGLMALYTTRKDNKPGKSSSDSSPEAGLYADKLRQVRDWKDSIIICNKSIDEWRTALPLATGAEKAGITASILSKEMRLPRLQDSLSAASEELQRIEMELLSKGITLNPDEIPVGADDYGTSPGFEFTRHSMGPSFTINIARPAFDYTFMVLEEGRFAEDNTLPDGIVYQIQLFASSAPATTSRLKGLSPVFMRRNNAGNYVYSAGVFRKYSDALSKLNTVKKAGFKDAMITAFQDGKLIAVSKARDLEKNAIALYNVKVFPSDGKSLSETDISFVQSVAQADISKVAEKGETVYILGPYRSRSDADGVVEKIRAFGISDVATEAAD